MNFPISIQKLSAQLLDKIPVHYSSNEIDIESARKKSIPVGGSSPNLTELKYDAKLPDDRSFFARNASFAKSQRSRKGKLAMEMAHSKSFIDLPRQDECPSPASSAFSKAESYHDYTQIKSTYTSNVRRKLARNEPIASHYYNEHMERYGKPPFVWGVRKSANYEDIIRPSRKPSAQFEFDC